MIAKEWGIKSKLSKKENNEGRNQILKQFRRGKWGIMYMTKKQLKEKYLKNMNIRKICDEFQLYI